MLLREFFKCCTEGHSVSTSTNNTLRSCSHQLDRLVKASLVPRPFRIILRGRRRRAWYPLFCWRHAFIRFSAKYLQGFIRPGFAWRRYHHSTPQPCSSRRSWRQTFLDALVGFCCCHSPKATVCRCSFVRIADRKLNKLRACMTSQNWWCILQINWTGRFSHGGIQFKSSTVCYVASEWPKPSVSGISVVPMMSFQRQLKKEEELQENDRLQIIYCLLCHIAREKPTDHPCM